MKTSELTGAALDWAVAKCESLCLGEDLFGLKSIITAPAFTQRFKPSTDWSQGGLIIEREYITIYAHVDGFKWCAECNTGEFYNKRYGPTPLIAAMRCYVASRLGDEVDIPGDLAGENKWD